MGSVDKFYGGPLDGQEQAVDSGSDEPRLDAGSGARYERCKELDTAEVRAWYVAPEEPVLSLSPITSIGLHAQKGEVITLAGLADFVKGALAMGYSDRTPVKALLSFSGKLRAVVVEP